MPPSKRLPCDDPEWTRRKAEIQQMYVFDRLSQIKIRKKLAEDGFCVTKSELEAQLRFWDIRKNASRDAWRYIDYSLLKRERQGKDSVVYYNSRKVTRRTLKKERNRYQPDTWTKCRMATKKEEAPKAPEGMELLIRTPTPAPLQSMWAHTLPWLRFQDTVLPFILNLTNSAIGDELLQRPDSPKQLALSSIHQLFNVHSLHNVSDLTANIASMMPEGVENEIFNRAQLIAHGAADQAFNEHIKLIMYCLSNNMYQAPKLEEDNSSWGAIVNLIERSGLMNQRLNLKQQDSTVASIAENLFKLCIEFRIHYSSSEGHASNSRVISWLLSSGQNPDVNVHPHSIDDDIFPLQDAARAYDCELAIELLEAGANPNGRSGGSSFTPLFMLLRDDFGMFKEMTPEEHKIFLILVERLLKAGTSLNEEPTNRTPSALMLAVCLDLHMADIMILHGANIKHQLQSNMYGDNRQSAFSQTQSVMGFSIHATDEEAAMRNMKHLLGHVQQSDPSVSMADLVTADVLCIAASRGFATIIKLCCNDEKSMIITEDVMFAALCAASHQGHREICELLLQYGAPVNGPDQAADTPSPLHFAALSDDFAVVELLCENGADVNAGFKAEKVYDDRTNDMWNWVLSCHNFKSFQDHMYPLHVNPLGAAIIGATAEMPSSCSVLAQYGAKLPIWAVYHAACSPPYPWIVHYAAEQGADLNWGPGSRTALQTALSRLNPMTPYAIKQQDRPWLLPNTYKDAYLEVISSLVNAGADTGGSDCELMVLLEHYSPSEDVSSQDLQSNSRRSSSKLSMLAAAFLTKSMPKLNRVLTQSPNAYDPGALCASVMLAISSGATDLCQRLLHNRPGDSHGWCQEGNALGLASWYNRTDILDILLSKMQGSTPALIPVYWANHEPELKVPTTPCKDDLEAIISQSFEESIPIWHREPQRGLELLRGSPLTLSIWSPDCLDKLLENRFYPDRLTISVAVCHGNVEVLAKLVRGRIVHDSHADRPGPLYLSVERRFKKMTEVLLKAGFSPNEPNDLVKFGRSPLQKAVEDGNLEVIDLLLEAGADVNVPAAGIGGATALQLAAITGRLGIAKRLIDLRANVNASGAEIGGRTALEGAAEHGRLDMVQFLLGCGANVIGDGCLQYFRAIRFAQLQEHRVVANLLLFHREWTSFEDEIWQQVLYLTKDGLEELGCLEDL